MLLKLYRFMKEKHCLTIILLCAIAFFMFFVGIVVFNWEAIMLSEKLRLQIMACAVPVISGPLTIFILRFAKGA